MQQSADTLADASRRLADGVQLLVDQTKRMGGGLDDAAAFLQAMRHDASSPSMSGFYIPAEILMQDDFKRAAKIFISPDGHAARYLVQTGLNPFNTEAMDQVTAITDTARGAQPNTSLADAKISMVGYTVTLRDTRDYYNQDLRLIIAVTIIVVLLILIVLLRAIVRAALPDRFGDRFLFSGARSRRLHVPIPPRPGVALERAGIGVHHLGRGGC